jgi:signal transduction histidine kinase
MRWARTHSTALIIGGVGVLTLIVGLYVTPSADVPDTSNAVFLLIQLTISLLLLAAAVWATRFDLDPFENGRLLYWVVGGGVVLGGLILAGNILAMKVFDGELNYFPITALGPTLSSGVLIGLLLGLYDMLQRREQHRIRSERERISVLNRVLRHDIRNDANVILGYLDQYLSSIDDDTTPSELQTIERRVNDILKIAQQCRRIEELLEQEETPTHQLDLADIVRAVLDQAHADYDDVSISTSLPDTAPVIAIDLLDSAVDNLIENAIEHNSRENPELEVSVTHSDLAGMGWCLRVSDNGPGIPDAEREVLESDHETPLKHASGLGLWIIQWIVHESDGTIEISDRDPHGTSVAVHLPGH